MVACTRCQKCRCKPSLINRRPVFRYAVPVGVPTSPSSCLTSGVNQAYNMRASVKKNNSGRDKEVSRHEQHVLQNGRLGRQDPTVTMGTVRSGDKIVVSGRSQLPSGGICRSGVNFDAPKVDYSGLISTFRGDFSVPRIELCCSTEFVLLLLEPEIWLLILGLISALLGTVFCSSDVHQSRANWGRNAIPVTISEGRPTRNKAQP